MITLACVRRVAAAPPTAFFARWIDHATWSEWSPDTEWVRIDGPVRRGARGILKPKGGPRAPFTISELETDRVYTDVSRVPGARLTFRHTAEPSAEGSVLSVEVTLDGPLAWLWARTAFSGFERSASEDLDRLIAVVEMPASSAR